MALLVHRQTKAEVLAETCQSLREHLSHPSTNPWKQVQRHENLKKAERLLQEELHKEKGS